MEDDRRGGRRYSQIRQACYFSAEKERLKHRGRPGIRPSCNVWLKGKRWQSVKLKSQDPITSISISPEVGTNGCGEVTPRVNKRIRGNRSFHIRFSLFDVLEIVDGEGRKGGDTMGNFGTRKSLPERVVSSRGNLKIDRGNSLSLQVHCVKIYLTNSWLSYLGKWNGPLEPIASHFAAVER